MENGQLTKDCKLFFYCGMRCCQKKKYITRPFSLTVGPQISKLKRQKALKTASMMTPLRTNARFLLDFVFVFMDIFRGQNITKITMIPIRIAGIKNTTYQSIRSNYEK